MAALEPPQPSPRVRAVAFFRPQILVFLATLLVASLPLRGVIVTGVQWWWADSYRQVDFVMDRAEPNSGSPYIDGHLDGAADVIRLVGVMRGDVIAPRAAPSEVFAPGKLVRIWHSVEAPNFTVEGEEVNDYPVAARPVLPAVTSVLGYLAMVLVTLVAGVRATQWVARRWALSWTVNSPTAT